MDRQPRQLVYWFVLSNRPCGKLFFQTEEHISRAGYILTPHRQTHTQKKFWNLRAPELLFIFTPYNAL
jgi:hypothetical protein